MGVKGTKLGSMSTAPKDGTKFLSFTSDGEYHVESWDKYSGNWMTVSLYNIFYEYLHDYPELIGWTNLPPKPKGF